MKNKIIVVWFSCGAASAIAAKKTIEKYGQWNKIFIVNNPVYEEHSDNLRFKKDVSDWLGYPILDARNTKVNTISARDIWEQERYMSGIKGAPCTKILKKQARYEFELNNSIDWHVLGFTADEQDRHDRFSKFERSNILPVLIEAGISKADCFSILLKEKIKIPQIYAIGFPNANCIGCVKSSSPTYWNMVRKEFPQVFNDRAEQSRRIGCKLIELKKKRIFLDELLPTDKGGKLKSWDCGIFCDTN